MRKVRGRASTIKIKINGICNNNCSFCNFNNDKSRLEVKDLNYFFNSIINIDFYRIVINGGEPTLHPNFQEISEYLIDRFKGKVSLELGTNMIPLSFKSRRDKLINIILKTYDKIAIGCDDEHNNIHMIEKYLPQFLNQGIDATINIVTPFCSDSTKKRIEKFGMKYDLRIRYSEEMHNYKKLELLNNVKVPCLFKTRDFLLNCNGDTFFCHEQEHEVPLFNLHSSISDDIKYYITDFEPNNYKFCSYCKKYTIN